jgi:hypothetical protein
MKTRLTLTLITLAGLIVFAGFVRGGNSSAAALATRVNPIIKALQLSIRPELDQTSLVVEHFRKTSNSVSRARALIPRAA